MTDIELARRLGDLRRAKGLSQSQLSTASGVNLMTIQKLESGVNRLMGAKVETVLKLTSALGITIESFLKEENTMTNEYILTNTPRQIATAHTMDEIEQEIRWLTVEPETIEDWFGGETAPGDLVDTITTVEQCERLLVDWYDRNGLERPDYDAAEMAKGIQLRAAQDARYDMDMDAE